MLNSLHKKQVLTWKIGSWSIWIQAIFKDRILSHSQTQPDDFLKQLLLSDIFIHKSKRSSIAILEEFPDWIAKHPIEKDKRLWQRFISLFRRGEAEREFWNSIILKEHFVSVPESIAYCERRVLGCIVDSRIVSERIFGEKSYLQSPAIMSELLHQLHEAGFIHSDPHINNFLTNENKESYIIDLSGVKKTSCIIKQLNDWALLEKSYPDIFQFTEIPEPYWLYTLIRQWVRFFKKYREQKFILKNKIRSLRASLKMVLL